MGQENNSQDLTHQHSHSTSELKAIARKREALEQVVRITLAINRLQQAFNAILNMGKAASKIPESALRIYSKLSNDVKHYSTQKLSESLERIERHVKEDLQTVLSFTQIAEGENQDTIADNLNDIDEDFLFKTINDFKRRAQTAVALGLLLRKRGITPKEAVIPIPKEVLVEKISNLEKREEHYRAKIKIEFTEMKKYINNLISDEQYPEVIKEEFKSINEAIERNLKHLESGRAIEDLPIAMEMVEIGSEEDHSVPFQPTSLPSDAPVEKKPEPEEKAIMVKRNIFSRLWEWCFAPYGTKWNDIPKYREQKTK